MLSFSFSDYGFPDLVAGEATDLESRNTQIHPKLRCADILIFSQLGEKRIYCLFKSFTFDQCITLCPHLCVQFGIGSAVQKVTTFSRWSII